VPLGEPMILLQLLTSNAWRVLVVSTLDGYP
jgi:hypothetical protein